MGANHSLQVEEESEEEEEDEEEEEEQEEEEDERNLNGPLLGRTQLGNHMVKKVLEQEPEMLPCHASASPLSPQLSSLGTPRLGPSIKVWDPYNVLGPQPPLLSPPALSRSFSANGMVPDDEAVTEVFLISHGECELNLAPDLVGGRCPAAALTANGMRQARALAVFLKSQGVRFSAVYSSPLDRARSTAVSVSKVLYSVWMCSILWKCKDHLHFECSTCVLAVYF
ncbi:hypothetical protein V8G54_011460 [Vigna mungo]|uniref:Uncharacterized protein n=1 Tax=Vigna mungo TaxID=3915 RepID=A0AAQ3S331_VIGMU